LPLQTWVQSLYSLEVAGPTITGTAAASSLLAPASPKYTFPASFFQYIGQQLVIRGCAQLGNIATTPGTITLDIRFGATFPGSTVVFTSGAMNMGATAHTALPIYYEILLTLRAIGTAANFMGQGVISGQPINVAAGGADLAGTVNTLMIPATAPAVGGNFDSTVSQVFDHMVTFSLANANAITLQQLKVLSLQ
jgi:hypothetical protein